MSTTAVLNLGINTKQFQKGLASASSSLAGFTLKATAGFAAVGVGVVGLAAVVGASFVKAASDADETTNKFNAVFSTLQKSANDTSKELAKSFGLSTRESEMLLGSTGDLLTGFGFTQKSALSLSKSVQELAADLTSFQNFQGGVEGASQAITAALTGETEKMKALGVVIRQGTTAYKDNVKALMQTRGLTELQAKATENLRIITEQSKNSIGDYAKTQFQLANLMKKWGKIWDNLKISMGRFISELLSVEQGAQRFTAAFEGMSNNVIGFLSNWRENFKTTFDWISDNAATLLANDIPILFAGLASYVGEVMTVMAKTMTDVFIIVGIDILKIWNKMWSEDMPNGMIKGLETIATKFQKRIKSVFSVKDLVIDFSSDLVNELLGGKKKTLGEKLTRSIGNNLKKLRAPTKLIDEIKTLLKTTELPDLNLKVKDDFIDAGKEAVGAINDELGKTKGTSKAKSKASTEFGGAFEKGSVDAYKVINQSTGNKTEIESLNVQKQIASNTSRNSQPQTLVMA